MSDRMPMLHLEKKRRKAELIVEFTGGTKSYPCTEKGCEEAGAALYNAGIVDWLCSSSVDFPEEYGCDADLDVRDVVLKGYMKQVEISRKPHNNLVIKMLAYCSNPEFQKSLTVDEQKAFEDIKEEKCPTK